LSNAPKLQSKRVNRPANRAACLLLRGLSEIEVEIINCPKNVEEREPGCLV